MEVATRSHSRRENGSKTAENLTKSCPVIPRSCIIKLEDVGLRNIFQRSRESY